VHCFVTRSVPETHELARLAAFDRELQLCRDPSLIVDAYPLRMII
jgi:hypothetical protein